MKRLDFLGLNSNQAACVLLYLIAVLWVLNFAARRVWMKAIFIAIEAALIVATAATMSRGGAVVLVCVTVYVRFLYGKWREHPAPVGGSKDAPPTLQSALRWFSYSPLWRVALLLTSPGLWARSAPGYVAQDASIGNRFELWKGAAKLIASAPLRGWGYYNTGASYMNWFQNVTDHTYYNGLVNSYLQIGAAFGLPVVGGVLFVLILALFVSHFQTHGLEARATSTRFISLLCFLWILIWMLMSCFSSMLSSPLLMLPPLAAVLMALFLHPSKKTELAGSLLISFSICLLIIALGRRLVENDSISISLDGSGIVTVANHEIKTGKTCVVYVDQGALGEEYGKELRKFLLGSDFERCVVVDKASYATIPELNIGHVNLIILSGITVDQVEIRKGAAQYLLLNPTFLAGCMPCDPILAIVYPEINRPCYFAPDGSTFNKFQSKIRLVPFHENFETSWSTYVDL